ncbi:MAG: YcfL family protein [Sedimentisphaerales bacterium]|nr:YcfL family protein [Sedimentisphaerales bacterium]
MKTTLNILLVLAAVYLVGCDEPVDNRINMDDEVRSDTLASNYVTRPIGDAFSALIGESIDIKRVATRTTEAGFMEVYVQGYNRAPSVKRFEYRVEWLDSQGLMLETTTSTWLPVSAKGKSTFQFKAIAPTRNAVDFRINTRKEVK